MLAGPDQLALTAKREIDLRQPEPVRLLGQRPQPLRQLGPEQQAQRGVGPAADPASKLVELGDPVSVGILDEHHGRVRHVDSHLDHGGRDHHVDLPCRKRPHRLLLGRRSHLAVQERDAEVGELTVAQAFELSGGRARLEQLGLLDERADDERLASGPQLLAHPLIRALALAGRRGHERLDRLAATRKLLSTVKSRSP